MNIPYTIRQDPDGYRVVLPDGEEVMRLDGTAFGTREEAEAAVRVVVEPAGDMRRPP